MKVKDSILGIKLYQAGKPISEVKRELGLNDIIKMASNENPLGCSPLVTSAIKEISDKVNYYPDASSYDLKKSISKHLGVSESRIFCGTGSDLLIRVICNLFVNNGDETVMGDVSFQRYEDSTRLMGGIPVKIPMKNHHLNIAEMVNAINEKTKIIWFCSPNNPTGPIITKDELCSVLDKIPSDVVIVMDEAYYEFVTDERYPQTIPMIDKYKNMIVLRTFSKAYGLAGLRIGYGVADEEIAKYMNSVIGPFDTNSVAQTAAVAALTDEDFVKKVVDNNTKGRDYIIKQCNIENIEYIETQANFIMIRTKIDDKEVFNSLLRKGIIIRPGYLFDMKGWIRVSIGTMEQNKRFMRELVNISKNIEK